MFFCTQNYATALDYINETIQKELDWMGCVKVIQKKVEFIDIRWATKILSESRLKKCKELNAAFLKGGHSLFPLTFSTDPNGSCQVILPPLAELYLDKEGNKRYLLLDGSHRVFAAALVSRSAEILVLEFLSPPPSLPCKPLLREQVNVLKTQPSLNELFVELNANNFRPIRNLVHRQFSFSTLMSALKSFDLKAESLNHVNSEI